MKKFIKILIALIIASLFISCSTDHADRVAPEWMQGNYRNIETGSLNSIYGDNISINISPNERYYLIARTTNSLTSDNSFKIIEGNKTFIFYNTFEDTYVFKIYEYGEERNFGRYLKTE